MKKKRDEYLLKSCLLGEGSKIFTQCKTYEENKSEYSIDKERCFSNEAANSVKNSAGYKDIYDLNNNSPRYTNLVLK